MVSSAYIFYFFFQLSEIEGLFLWSLDFIFGKIFTDFHVCLFREWLR